MDLESTLPGRMARARADDAGRFQMAGLAPGEYRVIAIPAAYLDPARLESFGRTALEQALAAGMKVQLDPRGFQSVTLELTEMR